jgi:hypothetical protein
VVDIKPLGFNVIEMSGYVTDDLIDRIDQLLSAKSDTYQQKAEYNYDLAARYFSYGVLRRKLRSILVNFEGIVEAIEPHTGA